jgi:polyisoprenyl-teichoic acid--peptidoglycan teichoic acid transferase
VAAAATGFALALLGVVAFVAVYRTPRRIEFDRPYPLTRRTNVLIMGLDRTVSDRNPNIIYPESRTDTLIAASFDPAARKAYLLSIPRDTVVGIPGHGTAKINAAHAWGEAPLTVRTVENCLGVRFPYYVEIRERGFVRLIDAVGGVNIRIDRDLNYDDNWDGLHVHLKKGYRRLGGKAAMEYARFRHDPQGDIGRIGRQQQVLAALLDELRRPGIVLRLDRILRVVRQDTATNLSRDQMMSLALFAVHLPRGGVIREMLPGRFEGNGDWLPDVSQDRNLVTRMFYGARADALARTTAEVITDGAGRPPVADALARIAALGIRIVRVRAGSDPSRSVVAVHRDVSRVAEILAGLLDATVIAEPTRNGPDLTIRLAAPSSRPPAGASGHGQRISKR